MNWKQVAEMTQAVRAGTMTISVTRPTFGDEAPPECTHDACPKPSTTRVRLGCCGGCPEPFEAVYFVCDNHQEQELALERVGR